MNYFELMWNDRKFNKSLYNLNNFFYIFTKPIKTVFLSKKIMHNNWHISDIIINKTIDTFPYQLKSLKKSINLLKINNYFLLAKLEFDTNLNFITNLSQKKKINIYVAGYCSSDNFQIYMLINGTSFNQLEIKNKLNIYKIAYDLQIQIKQIHINLNHFSYGFYFQPLFIKKNCIYDKTKYQLKYYLLETIEKQFLYKMNKYTKKEKILPLGIINYINVISQYWIKKIKKKVKLCKLNKYAIQEESKNRIKYTYGFSYIYNNQKLFNTTYKKKIYNKQIKLAAGIRYHPAIQEIPNWLKSLQSYLTDEIKIIDKNVNINQISIIDYFNETNKNVFVGLGPHAENNKFDYLVAVYIGENAQMAINLLWNTSNGEYSIELPANSVLVCDSYVYIIYVQHNIN